jgi:hypothetical protein
MAARKQKTQLQSTKDKIKASQLLNALANNGLGKRKHPMTSMEVRSIDVWLSYHLPKLAAMQVDSTEAVTVEVLYVGKPPE